MGSSDPSDRSRAKLRNWNVGMSRITALALTLAASIIASQSAQAGWQYTNWGMTPEEVIKASHGAAKPLASPGKPISWSYQTVYPLLTADFVALGMKLKVEFAFDAERHLQDVVLKREHKSDCSPLLVAVLATYGVRSATSPHTWWDEKNDNIVYLESAPPLLCQVSYRPLLKPNSPAGF